MDWVLRESILELLKNVERLLLTPGALGGRSSLYDSNPARVASMMSKVSMENSRYKAMVTA